MTNLNNKPFRGLDIFVSYVVTLSCQTHKIKAFTHHIPLRGSLLTVKQEELRWMS